AHLDDPVARDHDVHRALRRRAGAVDHRDAAEDEALEGPLAFAGRAIGGRPDGLRGGDAGEEAERHRDGEQSGPTGTRAAAGHRRVPRSAYYSRRMCALPGFRAAAILVAGLFVAVPAVASAQTAA